MSRRKQKTLYEPVRQSQDNSIQELTNFIPQNPFSNKYSMMQVPDSLQRFQWQLQNSLRLQREYKTEKNIKMQRKQIKTQPIQEDQQEINNYTVKKVTKLQKQISELKGQINNISKGTVIEDKLDRLLNEMIKNSEADREYLRKNSSSVQPNNIFYPPVPPPYYPPPSYNQGNYNKTTSSLRDRPKVRSRPRRNLRKYIFVVVFTVFLRSQAKRLAQRRRQNFRNFYVERFDPQILNLKNWLVESHGYAFPVILQKQDISLQFWKEKREIIENQKINLLLKLVQFGVDKMKKDCTPQKVSLFSELLQSLCGRGSFIMSRFWSALEMENICISQFYGCIRAEESLQKFLIGMVVFMKVLIFNMLLQPHKFDNTNFPKSKKQLTKNMYVIASTYYQLVKQVLSEYLNKSRPQYFRLGNWLNVQEEFIVQCCQPLVFNCDYPQQNQWISGMLSKQIQGLEGHQQWDNLKSKIKDTIEFLHKQTVKRRKEVIRNQKYKLYH